MIYLTLTSKFSYSSVFNSVFLTHDTVIIEARRNSSMPGTFSKHYFQVTQSAMKLLSTYRGSLCAWHSLKRTDWTSSSSLRSTHSNF